MWILKDGIEYFVIIDLVEIFKDEWVFNNVFDDEFVFDMYL